MVRSDRSWLAVAVHAPAREKAVVRRPRQAKNFATQMS